MENNESYHRSSFPCPRDPLDSLLIVEVRSLATDEVTTNQFSHRTEQDDNQWERDSLPSQSRTASTTGSDNRTQLKEPRITSDYTYLPHHENQLKSVIRYKDANNNQCEADDALQNGETEYLNALLPPKTQEAQAIQNGTSVNITKPNYDREHAHDVPYQEHSTNLSSKQKSAAGSKMSCVSSTESSNSLNTQMTAEKLAQKTYEDKEENIKGTESEGKAKQDSQDSVDEISSRREVTSQLPENEPRHASSEEDMESARSVETKRSFENENETKTEGEYEVDVVEGIDGSPKFKKFRAEQDDANSFQRTDPGNVRIDTFTASMKETLQIVGGKHERNNGPVKCFHCKQMFDNPTLLKVHAACHVLDKAFQCAFCGKKFTSTISHRTHLRIHTGEKPCTCKICGKSYRYSGHLTRHIRSHSGQRPHCCTICSKSFLSSGELCNHRRRHGNDKPFKCTQCQACFYFSRDLVTHRFTHANDTFNCPVCTVKFDDLTQMTEHIRTLHKMFRILVCKLCGKIFANPSRFKKHSYAHSSTTRKRRTASQMTQAMKHQPHLEQGLSCTICNKQFSTSKGLNLHSKKHAKDDLLRCVICGKNFLDNDKLRKHIEYHRGSVNGGNIGTTISSEIQPSGTVTESSFVKKLSLAESQKKIPSGGENNYNETEMKTANLIARSVELENEANAEIDHWPIHSQRRMQSRGELVHWKIPSSHEPIGTTKNKMKLTTEMNRAGQDESDLHLEKQEQEKEKMQNSSRPRYKPLQNEEELYFEDFTSSDEDSSDDQEEPMKRNESLHYIVYQKDGQVALSNVHEEGIKTTCERKEKPRKMLSFISSDRLGINNEVTSEREHQPSKQENRDFMTYTYIIPTFE